MTGESFERRKAFSLDKHLRGAFGVFTGDKIFDIVIRFSPDVADYIREKEWHQSQRLKELNNGGVELQLRLSSLVEIQRWILGWGGEAVVLEPPELVKSIHEAGRALVKAHQ